jgi:hypothetical protein
MTLADAPIQRFLLAKEFAVLEIVLRAAVSSQPHP